MNEWLGDNPGAAKLIAGLSLLIITTAIIWFGRRRLTVAIPTAFVVLLYFASTLPGCISARPAAQRNTCIANLRQIDGAKAEWAKLNGKRDDEIPTALDLYGTNKFIRHEPRCPRGGVYTIGAVNQPPTCTLTAKRHTLEEGRR